MVCLLHGSREVGVSMEHVYPMIDLRSTGQRIKELREQRGISVKQLQSFLGFEQPQAIYKWQRGECLPTFDNMYAIACYFNVKIDDILVGNRQEFFLRKFILLIAEKLFLSHGKVGSSEKCLENLIKNKNSCALLLLKSFCHRRIMNAGV